MASDPLGTSDLAAWVPQLRRVSRAMTTNRADADDLVQDTCVRALGSWTRFRQGSNIWAWLVTILHNLTRNRRRDQRRADIGIAALGGVVEPRSAEHAGEQALLSEALEPALHAALQSLPGILREAVWLRDVEDRTYAEIAQRLNIPAGTVMSRIARGRRLLHDRLVASLHSREQP
jgi:RNA polymerase sigma-70 factor (ECF subfamily)